MKKFFIKNKCLKILSVFLITIVISSILSINCFAVSYDPSLNGIEQYSYNNYVSFHSYTNVMATMIATNGYNWTESTIDSVTDFGEYTRFGVPSSAPYPGVPSSVTVSTGGKNMAPSSVITSEMKNLTFRFHVVYEIGLSSDTNGGISGIYLHDHYGFEISRKYFYIYDQPTHLGNPSLACKNVNQEVTYSNIVNNNNNAITLDVTYEIDFRNPDIDTIIYGFWLKMETNLSNATENLLLRDYPDLRTNFKFYVYDIDMGISRYEYSAYLQNFLSRLADYRAELDDATTDKFTVDTPYGTDYWSYDTIVDTFSEDILTNPDIMTGLACSSTLLSEIVRFKPLFLIVIASLVIGLVTYIVGLKSRGG